MDSTPSLDNVMVDLCCELGRKHTTLAEVRSLREQDVMELDKLAGESFEIRTNGRLFAWGEVVVVTDMIAVRITSLADSPEEVTS
jgi:flagellar motor switch protein FliN